MSLDWFFDETNLFISMLFELGSIFLGQSCVFMENIF